MSTYLNTFLLSLCVLCLFIQKSDRSALQNPIASHLSLFNEYNVSHHDNLDDSTHTHRHKHSEDGAEHEHHHDHSKHLQSDIKIISNSSPISTNYQLIESKNGFFEKNLTSNAHPFAIFRPPIA